MPLFQVKMILQNMDQVAPPPGDIQLTTLALDHFNAQYDLLLVFNETGNDLSGHLIYNVDLFDADAARSLMEQLALILEQLARHPETRLRSLELRTTREKEQALQERQKVADARLRALKRITAEPLQRQPSEE
jgi:non-ribosomal peptide synthetase component F